MQCLTSTTVSNIWARGKKEISTSSGEGLTMFCKRRHRQGREALRSQWFSALFESTRDLNTEGRRPGLSVIGESPLPEHTRESRGSYSSPRNEMQSNTLPTQIERRSFRMTKCVHSAPQSNIRNTLPRLGCSSFVCSNHSVFQNDSPPPPSKLGSTERAET